MSTAASEPSQSESSKTGWFKKVKSLMSRGTSEVGEEIQSLIEEREETEEPLSDNEKELIASALRFNDLDVEEVSVPRGDIVYLNSDDGFMTVVDKLVQSGYSRMPVCGENLDEVLGFITLKDIVKHIGHEGSFDMKSVMRPCTFIPDTLAVHAALAEMRSNRVQMAVVVDEYGGTSGLITFKDILEMLVGDIEDENEQVSPVMVIPMAGGKLRLDPRLPVNEMEESLKKKLGVDENEDYDTLGGYILHLAGRVPEKGEKVRLNKSYQLVVNEADGRRIKRVTLVPLKKK